MKETKKYTNISKMILGFPKNMNNTIGERCETTLKFKDMLTKCSFYWEEYDEKLFDHKPPEYKIKRG